MSGDIDLLRPLPVRSGVNVLAYAPLYPPRGSLLGFCDLHIPGFRLRLFGYTVRTRNDKRWVSLPGRPWIDRDSNLDKDGDTGKVKYQQIMGFGDDRVRFRFSDAALATLDAYAPHWSERG